MREGRLDLEWQQLVCLSEAAAASQHTEILRLCRNTDAVVAPVCSLSINVCVYATVSVSVCVCVDSVRVFWLIISPCHSAGKLLTVYLHAAVTVPIQECMPGLQSC